MYLTFKSIYGAEENTSVIDQYVKFFHVHPMTEELVTLLHLLSGNGGGSDAHLALHFVVSKPLSLRGPRHVSYMPLARAPQSLSFNPYLLQHTQPTIGGFLQFSAVVAST